ncbi:MAG: DUF502 domain-containing protein [Pleomorphochaeta sp.]
MKKEDTKLSKYIVNRFFTGFFVILPMSVTIWLIYKIVIIGDAFFAKVLEQYFDKPIPGLGFVITIFLIFIIGVLVNSLVGRKIRDLVELFFLRIPIIKSIYSPLKDFTENFSKKDSSNFKKVVFVNFPNDKLSNSIGFITNESVMINNVDKTAIFIPTTPNPTNGFLIYLNKEDYVELDMKVDEALKTIVSLGAVSPDRIELK